MAKSLFGKVNGIDRQKQKETFLNFYSEFFFGHTNVGFIGKDANVEERKAAMKTADEFIKKMGYPKHTQGSDSPGTGRDRLSSNNSSKNWHDVDQTEGLGVAYVSNSIAKIEKVPFDASTLHDSTSHGRPTWNDR